MPENQGIAPELLQYVVDYVDETALESVLEDVESESNLIVFCRELFGQLFANVIGEAITGIGAASAQRANVLRRTRGRTWPGSLRRLVGHFQHFCKIYRDLLGEGYSGGSDARSEFHFTFIPNVMNDLEAWAKESEAPDLAEAITRARRRYDEYLSTWADES